MKKRIVGCLVGVLGLGLAACGGTPAPGDGEQAGGSDPLRYVLGGQVLAAEAVKSLEAQHGRLFYLVSSDGFGPVAQVFTRQADLERAKGEAHSQALCVSTRPRTTVYDHDSYGGDRLEISKGASISDLGTRFQADGEDWDNDITSFKAAHCVYTYLYTGTSFTGSLWVTKGTSFSAMGGWNQIISSIVVDP